MLVEFTVGNFRSFRGKQTLSLISCGGKDKKHPDHLIPCGKMKLLKAVSVHGSNASGKSNLINALGVMMSFVRESATQMNQGDVIPGVSPFVLDRGCVDRPSFFSAHVVIGENHYEYSFSVTSRRVHTEKLIVSSPRKPQQVWLERTLDEAMGQVEWRFDGPLTVDRELIQKRTRPNGLALSRGAELNIEAFGELFLWFRERAWFFDLSFPPIELAQRTASRMKQDSGLHARVARLLRHADFGIEGVRIDRHEPVAELPAHVREMLSEKGVHSIQPPVPSLDVRFLHTAKAGQRIELSLGSESEGTKRFFALMGPFLDALDWGALLVVDELEASMHPLLTRKLVELFQSLQANKKGAQLIFATHDSTLMDPALFRRDQVWLVEKDREGASELFSLYDFDPSTRPRNQEAFEKNYLAGRYGAVPNFGPALEDLEFAWEADEAE